MSGTIGTDHRHELCTEVHPAYQHDAMHRPHCVECGEPMSAPAAPAPAGDAPVQAIDLCNACGIFRMGDNPAGYCDQCLAEAKRQFTGS